MTTGPSATVPRRFPAERPSLSLLRAVVLMLLGWGSVSGCATPHSAMTSLPKKYEFESEDLIVRSDLKITADNELIGELKEIRRELKETLELPPPHRPVVIHLFGDENRYREYMQSRHPNLPPRRAFFIGSPTELGVYAHWSPNVGEDLRHEYTHGVLHASLRTVPLWLDEGLAEYFETPSSTSDRLHVEHTQRLALALKNGWRPELARLETIEDVGQMGQADYQEAWAWIHFLLNDAPAGREVLVDYCRALRRSDKPPRFRELMAAAFPDAETRLASYISLSLTDHGRLTAAEGKAVTRRR